MYYKICHNNTTRAEPKFYDKKKKYGDGIFVCPCCDNILYDTKDMYDSGTGWPAFSDTHNNQSVRYNSETSEVTCHRCGLHPRPERGCALTL